MSRARKTPFPSWLSKKSDGYEQRYIRLGNSFLMDEKVKSLNHVAFRVYVYMLLESGGKMEFQFPRSKYIKWCSKGGFQKAVTELEQAGFIEVVQRNKNLRIPNVYRFSSRWEEES